MRRMVVAASIALAVVLVTAPASLSGSDPYRSSQWGLDKLQAEAAWATSTGTGVLVAVIDSGVDLTHPDLQANLVSYLDADMVEPAGTCTPAGAGKEATCVQDGAQDANGHGTHVAGIIAAVAGNGVGVAGVAPDARVLPVRVLDAKGSGTAQQVASGITYAVDKGARVLNLSLTFRSGLGQAVKIVGGLEPIYAAVDDAIARGAVVVVAAGNDAIPLCAEPSGHPGVLCVGATDARDVRSWFSNADATLTQHFVVAPGGDGVTCGGSVLSTYLRSAEQVCADEPGYEAAAGTSMAAPHVAGVAALLVAKGLPASAVVACIEKTADDLGVPGRDAVYGYGRVNAAKAVAAC